VSKYRGKVTPASPRIRTRTEEQSDADARVRNAQRRAAGRQAFRWLMLLSHGCTGRSCASDRHPADLAGLRDVLMALGLAPDPLTDWKPGPGYSRGSQRVRDEATG
jgi:hypothetical protein